MNIRRSVGVALLAAATATACSSGADTGKPASGATASRTTAPTPAGTPSAVHRGALRMGTTKTINDTKQDVHITIQAVQYQQPYKGPQPHKPAAVQGGDVWAVARIKVCNLSGPAINVNQTAWSLGYADGTSIDVTGEAGGDMPKPEYPIRKAVPAGRCAAGLVPFPVPSKKRPDRIVYQPADNVLMEWSVPE
ncbi:DUF4352 domain-containing protein [Streptomyces sp. NPDC029006]|uniref:DUF4352 domain-containing protein n=1 Tax=Streptomyces sp. NPDC029006 TaxID=3155467 RepID=UPI0033CE448A